MKTRIWLFGILLGAAVILILVNLGNIGEFFRIMGQARWEWLAMGLIFQLITFVFVAAAWWGVLREAGAPCSLWSIVPLGVGKHFSDQALPSAGLSGTAFMVATLGRRGIPLPICMSAMVAGMIGYYAAFLVSTWAAGIILWRMGNLEKWILISMLLFSLLAVGVPAGILFTQRWSAGVIPVWVSRISLFSELWDAFARAPLELVLKPGVILWTSLMNLAVFLLDIATLWAMLHAIGLPLSWWWAFPAYVMGSVAAALGLIPLGLGTFEGACALVLFHLGLSWEAAMAATLLVRGYILWLPMVPGLWLTRREMVR